MRDMPYMIPYYQSGLLVKFRCTDCDWTYRVQNPSSATVLRDEEERAKELYTAHRCSEFSSKTAKK
jgi:transposase-like protein